MNVILLGYRGSGKTSVGRLLADRLGYDFVDVDVLTSARLGGRTIAQIWAEDGEPVWRRAEVESTRDLCRRSKLVIGLGGGTLTQPGALEAVKNAAAFRVYLRCNVEELHRRIHADQQTAATRPALTKLGGGVDEIRHVLEQREPTYITTADLIIDVTKLTVFEIADVILLALQSKN